tara:strand:+ start:2258 stop:2488 length:231 start_codon:yes stop_codon:yes gene_type:complete
MKEQLIEQCLLILSREDVKKELKELFKPLVSLIVQEIYPYIYLSLIFVIMSFLLILGIFYLLLRTNLKSISLNNIF